MSPETTAQNAGNGQQQGSGRNRDDRPTDEELEIRNYWTRTGQPLPVRDYQWKVVAWRGDAPLKRQRLDGMMTNLTWEDATIQTATLTMIKPQRFNFGVGHRLTVYWSHKVGAKWHKLWSLRVTEVTEEVGDGTLSLTAADELSWLQKSRGDFAYRKGEGKAREKRPDGWKAHQIVRDVCRQYGIKVGTLVKGTATINKLVEDNASPLAVITKAYEKEREETGFKYVIAMRGGKLSVTRLRRSRELLIYGGQALAATITKRVNAKLATELEVTGKVEDGEGGKDEKTITVKAKPKVLARYGHVRNFWSADEPAKSVKALRQEARRELVDRQEPEREVSLTVPGYPGLQRGDAIKVALRSSGIKEIMYVTGASHSVSPGDYQTTLELSFEEFYIDKDGEATLEKRREKAEKNGRKPPKGLWAEDIFRPASKQPRPKQPKKAKNRGDKK